MKKIYLAAALAFVSHVGFSQTTDEAFKKDVLKVIEASGGTSQMKPVMDMFMKMIPKEKQAAFVVEFNATLPDLYDKLAAVYMETYSKEDIQSMLAFYESPVGKKIIEKRDVLVDKSMEAGKDWGESLQPLMMKYIQE